MGGRTFPIPDLLECFAASLRGDTTDGDLHAARDLFVSAGLSALRVVDREAAWLQYGISPRPAVRRRVYGALEAAAADQLADGRAEEFFFMHKPPGLRIRFQVRGERIAERDAWIRARLEQWRRDGLISGWVPGVYEPERYLFGGPVSMRGVHRVFTADSRLWLAHHGSAAADGGGPPTATWALSLLMIRTLLDALEIEGWEDRDVFDRLRWQTGRRLDGDLASRAAGVRLTAVLRAGRQTPDRLLELLPAHMLDAFGAYRTAVHRAGAQWLAEYFHSGRPGIGPREAAAYAIVFHWNRGGLPLVRQAPIAEALTASPAGAAR